MPWGVQAAHPQDRAAFFDELFGAAPAVAVAGEAAPLTQLEPLLERAAQLWDLTPVLP